LDPTYKYKKIVMSIPSGNFADDIAPDTTDSWNPKELISKAKEAQEEEVAQHLIDAGTAWPAANAPGADAFILKQTMYMPEHYPCKPLDVHISAASKDLQQEFLRLSAGEPSARTTCHKPIDCLDTDPHSQCFKDMEKYIAAVQNDTTGEGLLWFPIPRSNGGLTNRMYVLVRTALA
jgi:hypothetical protein